MNMLVMKSILMIINYSYDHDDGGDDDVDVCNINNSAQASPLSTTHIKQKGNLGGNNFEVTNILRSDDLEETHSKRLD